MADILIKGLALPKDKLEYLHLIIQDGKVHTAISCGHLTTDKLNVATAIELPPHGEAKDTDIAIKYIKSEMEDDFNETTTLDEKSYKEGMKRAIELIGYAPTIVEASNGSDN